MVQNSHSAPSNRRRVRVLVTAFGAFPGAPANPTEAIIRRLQREPRFALADIDLRVAVMPVRFAGVEARVAALLEAHRPDIVIHLGLAGRRRAISIEARARNRLTVLHPDADGAINRQFTVTPGGPALRFARWNPVQLVHAVHDAGVPVAVSQDAGDYLCNQTLYVTLDLFDGPAGFIHVPRLRRRRPIPRLSAGRRPLSTPLPSLSEATQAVAIAVRLLARTQTFSRKAQ
ncbi:pyroglutamyl-peptidase I [Methylocella sp. CPCC 101449]|uniref:pyroglutamyl-peptidase I n=1 Tax=Methylocella sp. CPCC 101449 TaxID=2987531 RepID=UPI00288EEF96|nr:pyroglutamyl-peptidase I [Methylocella sp. CPCC 101449]MDT2024189.1 pyroglutamyl-peptidase I [Methylocella sp. CPCC 101449]